MAADAAIAEPVDAEVVDETEAPPTSREVVRHEAAAVTVAPQVGASELVARLGTIREAMETAMTPNVDYGVIPGTGSKPTLLKPGAEKLSALFQLDVQLVNEKVWDGQHLTVISHATVYHSPTGTRLGYGEGVCSTRERKYAYRKAQRACPSCGQPAIIKGKQEYGGGWVCFEKKGGCKAKFPDNDERIIGQQVGEIENPDLADVWNTVVKMGEKRARVDAVLAVTGASALFTQDVEDQPHAAETKSDSEEVEQLSKQLAAIAADVAAHPFGRALSKERAPALGAAAKKLASGNSEGGKALWAAVKEKCGGYGPEAAAIALIEAAGKLDAVPFDPQYVDPTGDIPGGQATMDAAGSPVEVTETMLAGLGDEVLTAWLEAGASEQEAMSVVQGHMRKRTPEARWNSLQVSLTKARETKARKEAIR